jgi:tetratricopeptide (TPR) repeat protein
MLQSLKNTIRAGRGCARLGILLLAGVISTGCDLDLTNPNAPTEQEVLSDPEGLIALAVGMQGQYAGSIITYVRAPALVTDELGTTTKSLPSDQSLLTGVGLDASFGVVEGPYAATYRVVRSANNVLQSAPRLGLGKGLEAGLVALAKTFKAMALGMIIQQYERVPINVAVTGAEPKDRATVLNEVISLLESARADLGTVSDADLATLRARVLGTGFDLRNTVDAMLARYYLISGQYQKAIEAADRVPLNRLSVFTYPDPAVNPIYNYAIAAGYLAPLRSWARAAEVGDKRVSFWAALNQPAPPGNPSDTALVALGEYTNRNDPFPVYLPDEMRLIKAEAYTRLGNLEQARTLVNQVRTQASSPVNEPVAALPALPASALDTQDELLNQIAYERRYELFLQGLRWEDMRRLGKYIREKPTFTFLPLPTQECQTNPLANCAG